MDNLIQVLWVEDDPNVTESYPLEAENEGLQLVAYPCWVEAKEALEKDYDKWSAIILDAKCKFHRDSKDSAIVFLREALKDISVIATEKHRVIPWFVLSGGAEIEISDSINEERLKWDEDWTRSSNKTFYSKNTDREILFQRIRAKANISPRLQIQERYKNVFDAMTKCCIEDEAINAMEDLLISIHSPNSTTEKDHKGLYAKARITLESTMKSMSIWGILPDWGNNINLQWSCVLLDGMEAKNKYDKIFYKSKMPIIPKILASCLKEMVNTIPTILHSNDKIDVTEKRILPEYLPLVDYSPYLLSSYTFQICDLILWYRNYLKEHNNKEENSKNWEKVC